MLLKIKGISRLSLRKLRPNELAAIFIFVFNIIYQEFVISYIKEVFFFFNYDNRCFQHLQHNRLLQVTLQIKMKLHKHHKLSPHCHPFVTQIKFKLLHKLLCLLILQFYNQKKRTVVLHHPVSKGKRQDICLHNNKRLLTYHCHHQVNMRHQLFQRKTTNWILHQVRNESYIIYYF